MMVTEAERRFAVRLAPRRLVAAHVPIEPRRGSARASRFRTLADVHSPPRGARMPRALSTRAMPA